MPFGRARAKLREEDPGRRQELDVTKSVQWQNALFQFKLKQSTMFNQGQSIYAGWLFTHKKTDYLTLGINPSNHYFQMTKHVTKGKGQRSR